MNAKKLVTATLAAASVFGAVTLALAQTAGTSTSPQSQGMQQPSDSTTPSNRDSSGAIRSPDSSGTDGTVGNNLNGTASGSGRGNSINGGSTSTDGTSTMGNGTGSSTDSGNGGKRTTERAARPDRN
jgi:hypothetical protein